MAAECFNPQLFAVGTTYILSYALEGSLGGTVTRHTDVRSSPADAAERQVVTDISADHSPPVPGDVPFRIRRVQSLNGLQVVTTAEFQSVPTKSPDEIPTVYQPPLRDDRFSLGPGDEFVLTRSVVQASGTSTSSSIVRYEGQEGVTVPVGTFTACKFTERLTGCDVRTSWVAKGSGVLLKTSQPGQTESLIAAQIDGVPVKP